MRNPLLVQAQRWLSRAFGLPIGYKNIRGFFNGRTLYARIADSLPAGAHIVEVGCFHGRSTCFMAHRLKKLGKKVRFDVVDTFEGSPEHQKDLKGGSFYEEFLQNMRDAKVLDMLNVRKGRSEEAYAAYTDGSLDFVYIDAAHEYDAVKRDIGLWLPKVKPGGVLAGDDYHPSWQGVIDAVHELLGQGNVEIIDQTQWLYRRPDNS